MRRSFAAASAGVLGALALTGCTLTATEDYEHSLAARAAYRVDAGVWGAKDVECTDVPWLSAADADSMYRCLTLDLEHGAARETAVAIAEAYAVETKGEHTGVVCGQVDGIEVQCASYATVPDARNANVEIWVALADVDVAALTPEKERGQYWVTFHMVPYGPDFLTPDDGDVA